MGAVDAIRAIAALIVAGIAFAASFVAHTVLLGHVPDAVLVAAGAFGALVMALVVHGPATARELVARPGSLLLAAIGGILALWAAPFVVLAARASDAPPGSVVAFMTTSAWGLSLAIAGSAALGPRAPRALVVASAALAALGGAAVLASWERPSSFSPFVVFAAREARMLAAGVLFAAGVLMVERASRSRGSGPAIVAAAAAAGVAGLLGGLASPLPLTALVGRAGPLVVLAIAVGVGAVNLLRAACAAGPARAGIALLSVPGLLTALTMAERALWIHGPDPVVWSGALAGIALIGLGSLALWVATVRPAEHKAGPRLRAPIALAAALAATSAATLVLPAMRAEVIGVFGKTFSASWEMLGVETAGGWLVALAGAAAGALLAPAGAVPSRSRRLVALVVLLVAALYAPLAAIPLRTLTRWIPADVQQTYGTEYARITFTPIHHGLRLAVLAVVAIAAATVLVRARAAAEDRPVKKGAA